jgi:hypothetical protein
VDLISTLVKGSDIIPLKRGILALGELNRTVDEEKAVLAAIQKIR